MPIDLGHFAEAVTNRTERLFRHAEKQKVFGWFCTYTPIELIQSGQARCWFRIRYLTSTNLDGKSETFCFNDVKLIVKYTAP